jgi:TRAP-type mannitol/chloroaromatic compound transport system permease small subunit
MKYERGMPMKKVLHWIDSINQWVGNVLPPVVIIMALITAYEVAMRYLFNSPTRWVWSTNDYLLTIIGLAGGYCVLKNTHIRVDVFTNLFSKRMKALIELFTSPALFLFISVMLWWSAKLAWDSFAKGEFDQFLHFPIPPYIQKTLVCLAALLVLLQGVAKFIRDLRTVIYGAEEKEEAQP